VPLQPATSSTQAAVPAATRQAAVDAILDMAVLSGGPVASR
jgi:hypothetical protein